MPAEPWPDTIIDPARAYQIAGAYGIDPLKGRTGDSLLMRYVSEEQP